MYLPAPMTLPFATRLDRYVFRQLAGAAFAVTLALVALIWLVQSLKFVELVVNRGLSLRVFLELTGLLIPNFIAVILPITTFVVVLFIYQRLAGDRELTVMSTAGLSPLALARPAVMLSTVSMAICLALNLWLVPLSLREFREFQFEIRNRIAAFLLQEGVFTPVSDDLTVYVRAREQDGTLRGVMVEDDRDKGTRATIFAERGRLIDAGADVAPHVMLYNGSREEIDRRTGRLDVLTFSQNSIDLNRSKAAEEQRFRDSSEMSLGELLHPDPSELSNQHDFGKFLVEAHRRLSAPLTALSFAMVALVAVLTGPFSRHGNVLRPLVAIGAVVGLLALSLATQNIAARSPELLPLVWIAACLPIPPCAWALFAPSLLGARPLPLPIPEAA